MARGTRAACGWALPRSPRFGWAPTRCARSRTCSLPSFTARPRVSSHPDRTRASPHSCSSASTSRSCGPRAPGWTTSSPDTRSTPRSSSDDPRRAPPTVSGGAGGPEAFDADGGCGDAGSEEQVGGVVGEPGRAADVGGGRSIGQGGNVGRVEPSGWARRAGRVAAGVDDGGLGPGQLGGGVQGVGRTDRDDETDELGPSGSAGEAEHGHERNHTGSAAYEEHRGRALPDEPSADGPANLEIVTRLGDVVEEGRDLSVVETFDGEVELR